MLGKELSNHGNGLAMLFGNIETPSGKNNNILSQIQKIFGNEVPNELKTLLKKDDGKNFENLLAGELVGNLKEFNWLDKKVDDLFENEKGEVPLSKLTDIILAHNEGNIINDTYGKGSTNYDEGGTRYTPVGPNNNSSVVTKSSLHGEILTVTSLSVVNLSHIHTQHQEIAKCENELNQYIKKYISNVKKEFKKKEYAGRALKCNQIKNSERNSVEMINHYAENRRAIIRRSIDFEVG